LDREAGLLVIKYYSWSNLKSADASATALSIVP
jgi:hypothetical protein